MDRELIDLQVLGLCGIFREGWNILFSFKKIFSQITLALVFPLTFILLAKIQITTLIFGRIAIYEFYTDNFAAGTYRYSYARRHHISAEVAMFWLFKAGYLIFLLIFSLLSTSAVVYSVACIYTAKPMSFKKVMSVVPKVWKRLLVTFLWNSLIMVAYHIAMVVVLVLWGISLGDTGAALVSLIILVILYFVGFVYINVIWQLASVVSVLEEIYGIKAMKKSRVLIKGKMGAASFIFVLVYIFLVGIETVFEIFSVDGIFLAFGYRVMIGIGCLMFLLVIILYGLLVQAVIYFVCKSYHNETIDKPLLADHLESYMGDYVHLNGRKDVQMEQMHV